MRRAGNTRLAVKRRAACPAVMNTAPEATLMTTGEEMNNAAGQFK